MGNIVKLPSILINQIAAGEVVERPVSVVKELVENSIDAGGTYIKVEIQQGGIEEIIISDNGCGIEKEDLFILTEKHTTSKIKSIQDLHNIMTFGFRGEALASISSVSKFKITSNSGGQSGYSLEVTGGEKGEINEESINQGTKIIVKDLFFNTPARLNYLKKERTEYGHIYEFLNQISLAHPQIGFEFISDSKSVFKYKQDEDLKTRIYNIFGNEFYDNLLEINFSISGLNITGYISNPKTHFLNRNRQVIFVNNRIISSPLIYKAINESYNRYIPHSTFPGYILNLQINPEEIDVNVHPRKQEIRFAREQEIYRAFYNAISSKLENSSLVQSTGEFNNYNSVFSSEAERSVLEINNEISKNNIVSKEQIPPFQSEGHFRLGHNSTQYYTGSGTKFKSYSPYKNLESNPAQFSIKESIDFTKTLLGNENGLDLHYTKLGKIIGQVFNSYIIVENEDKLIMLDQHALAERIIFEKLSKTDFKKESQKLLIGETLNLNPKEIVILEDYKDIFTDMGFEYEFMSGSNIIINSVPNFLAGDIKNIFLGIISDIGEFGSTKSINLDEIKNKIWAYTSCRSAIKFGNKLNLFEMNKLLNDSVLTYSSTCPHGRPSIFEISLEELKKKYDR